MNLLPYREARRKETRQRFWAGFGLACGVAVLGVAAVHVGISGYISVQDGRNAFIKAKNEILDGRIKEIGVLRENIQSVKAQQEIIGKLQSDRASPTHLLDQMVRLVPDGMLITSLKQKNSDVVVNGVAQSSDMVSSFMVSIQQSPFLSNPELIEIKASVSKEGRRMQQFSLKFVLRSSKDDKPESKEKGVKPAGPSSPAASVSAAPVSVPAAPVGALAAAAKTTPTTPTAPVPAALK